MERPTLQQLSYLVAVAEHRHFGRAAQACYVSQPALSAQFAELERRLGVRLAERNRRTVVLTPAGHEAVRRAKTILTSTDELAEAVGAVDGPLVGPVELGVIPTMGPYLLPVVVRTLGAIEGVRLGLHEHRTADLVPRVLDGDLDLALMAGPVDERGLHSELLALDPFLVAVGAGHRWAARRSPIRSDDLADATVLLLEDGHCLREQAMAACALAGAPTIDARGTSLGTLTQMVAADMGVTLLPASTAAVEARNGSGVSVVKFAKPAPSRQIVLVWRAASPRSPRYRELAEQLRPGMAEATRAGLVRASDRA